MVFSGVAQNCEAFVGVHADTDAKSDATNEAYVIAFFLLHSKTGGTDGDAFAAQVRAYL